MKSKLLGQDKQNLRPLAEIGGGCYMRKMTKGLPPLRIKKLNIKSQQKDDEIKKKIYTAKRNWNDWKFQLHRNKLEWVNTIIKIKRKNLFSFLKVIIY